MAVPAEQMEDRLRPMDPAKSGVKRDDAGEQAPEQRRKLVAKRIAQVKAAKKHWQPQFDRMRADMKFTKGLQWPDQESLDDDRYVANIVKRHIHQRTAALYAKDPKAIAERRERLDFELWDGNAQTLIVAWQQIQRIAQMGGDPQVEAPQQMALIQDVQQGAQLRQRVEKVGKTLEILFHYFLGEQRYGFKRQMKQLVRRTLITGVGYVKLGFQRLLERDPDIESRMEDVTERMHYFQRLLDDFQDGEIEPDSSEYEELRLTYDRLSEEVDVIVREGLVFDFPRSTAIIPDPNCRSIEGGFIGADWVAEEFLKTPDEIQEIYGVDIGQEYEKFDDDGNKKAKPKSVDGNWEDDEDSGKARLYEIYHRKTGLKYSVVEGYPDFLEDPQAPYPEIDHFFPLFPLTFNQTEDEEDPYPISDVRELKHIQMEYNRSKEGLRQHRIANRPLYVTAAGKLEESDQKSLAGHPAHAVIPLQGLGEQERVGDLLQPVQKVPIDPNVYEVSTLYADLLRVSGDQEANLGGTSGATAYEVGVAEQTRVSSISSNIDDMDQLLSEIAQNSGKVLLMEMSAEQVKRLAGRGAVWPEMSRADIAEELYLEIEAGSSGRPNQTQQIANLERVAPFLLQTPGVNPNWMAKYMIKILDDKLDPKDAILEGLPAMVAMNGEKQVATGDSRSDPNQQGSQGGQQTSTPGPARGSPGPGSAGGSSPPPA